MSLLLEALKRAEDKGRRRQAGAAGAVPQDRLAAGAGPLPALDLHGPGEPELAVELTSAPPVDPPPHEPVAATVAAATWEPKLALASAPAPLEPTPAPAAAPTLPRRPAAARPLPPPAPAPRPAAADARAAERLLQAQAQAQAQARPAAGRGRQGWLLAAVALVGAGVAALWFWPEEPLPQRHAAVAQGPVDTAPVPAPTAPAPPVAAPPPPAVPQPAEAAPPVQAQPAAPSASLPAPGTLASAPPRPVDPPSPPAARVVAESPAPPRLEPGVRASRPATGTPSRPPAAVPATAAVESAAAPAAPSPRQLAAAQVQQQLQQAYADFQAGRTQEATQAWRDVVRLDPTQRDAWLGLAISAHRQGQRDNALAAYQQVLRLDPDNGEAVAAIAALEATSSDPASESRLREALQRNPGHAMLNSALARLLSSQGRWDEAQPFWFAAHAGAPDQPAHAYNLAVALDRLRKAPLAAQYYRRALELQQGRAAAFDVAAARARLQVLEDAARAGTP